MIYSVYVNVTIVSDVNLLETGPCGNSRFKMKSELFKLSREATFSLRACMKVQGATVVTLASALAWVCHTKVSQVI